MKIFYYFFNYYLPIFLWSLLIFSFSSRPTGLVSQVYWQDVFVKKAAHVAEYGVFAVLIYRALINSKFQKKHAVFFAILISVVYAFTDEFHQSFTPTREPHIRDVIFDTIGASSAVLLTWKYLPKAPMKLRNLGKILDLV